MTDEVRALRLRLIEEEAKEVCDELRDRISFFALQKELCDLLYVVFGTFVAMGVDAEDFFETVHRNNMTKVSGKVEMKDGKVQKPASYRPVQLEVFTEYEPNEVLLRSQVDPELSPLTFE